MLTINIDLRALVFVLICAVATLAYAADTKISALTELTSGNLASGDLFAVVDVSDTTMAASGTDKKLQASSAATYFWNAPLFAAGSASASSWPRLNTGGTLLTTAEDGAIEMDADAYYLTTDAGNRGVVPAMHCIRADATRTFTSNTSQQAIFNSPTNGRLTLETGTYLFDALISMDTMSATSGNGKFSLNNGGTATLGSILYLAGGQDAALNTAGTISGISEVAETVVAANTVTAGTATVMTFFVRGTFQVTGAGTIIPSFAQTTAAAAVVKVGSYFCANRIGSTTMVSVGQWD